MEFFWFAGLVCYGRHSHDHIIVLEQPAPFGAYGKQIGSANSNSRVDIGYHGWPELAALFIAFEVRLGSAEAWRLLELKGTHSTCTDATNSNRMWRTFMKLMTRVSEVYIELYVLTCDASICHVLSCFLCT